MQSGLDGNQYRVIFRSAGVSVCINKGIPLWKVYLQKDCKRIADVQDYVKQQKYRRFLERRPRRMYVCVVLCAVVEFFSKIQ